MLRTTILKVILGSTRVFGLIGIMASVLTVFMARSFHGSIDEEVFLAVMLAPPPIGLVFGLIVGCAACACASWFGKDPEDLSINPKDAK